MNNNKKEPSQQSDQSSKDKAKVQKLDDLLKSSLIDVKDELKPPQMAWFMEKRSGVKSEKLIIGTLGNFSLIIGKAKSKKSFFINIAISAAISKQPIFNKFGSSLPENQRTILYFDTEQGKYHVQLALKRICKQTNIVEPDNLKVYGLRSLSPKERLDLIEHAINTTPNLGFVVIDGIKDLVTSINDEEQSTMISSKLLKWTEEKNIHIICVLHQNKSDNNARGHIGTELINKAETVLSISVDDKDKEISVMNPEMTRNKEPEPFAFKIDHRGLPIEVTDYSFSKVQERQRSIINRIDETAKFELLEEVYSHEEKFTHSELIIQVKLAIKTLYKESIGDTKAREFITYCKNQGYLLQSGKRKPWTLINKPKNLYRDDQEIVPF